MPVHHLNSALVSKDLTFSSQEMEAIWYLIRAPLRYSAQRARLREGGGVQILSQLPNLRKSGHNEAGEAAKESY